MILKYTKGQISHAKYIFAKSLFQPIFIISYNLLLHISKAIISRRLFTSTDVSSSYSRRLCRRLLSSCPVCLSVCLSVCPGNFVTAITPLPLPLSSSSSRFYLIFNWNRDLLFFTKFR